MSEIKPVAFHVQPLDSFWVMVAANMEVSWNFIDKYKPSKLTPLTILYLFQCLLHHFDSLSLPIFAFKEFICSLFLCIDFSMSIFINMVIFTYLIALLVNAHFLKFSSYVDDVDYGHIDYV